MFGTRIGYLAVLLGAFTFYIASGEWISFILLAVLLALPLLSLALSVRAIRQLEVSPAGLEIMETGEQTELWLLGSCPSPMPPFHGQLQLRFCFTGECVRYRAPSDLRTEHCGGIVVTAEKIRVCDYLGLFSFRVRRVEPKTVRIRPRPLAPAQAPELQDFLPRRWRPKPGGGFAENHELRLYRPGDALNQVHWKLTAKTGKLMIREPVEPVRGRMLLTLTLRGTPDELDRKLGRMLWLGDFLLRQSLPFEIAVLTGEGLLSFSVKTQKELYQALDTLLCKPVCPDGSVRSYEFSASWQYHIGGRADES